MARLIKPFTDGLLAPRGFNTLNAYPLIPEMPTIESVRETMRRLSETAEEDRAIMSELSRQIHDFSKAVILWAEEEDVVLYHAGDEASDQTKKLLSGLLETYPEHKGQVRVNTHVSKTSLSIVDERPYKALIEPFIGVMERQDADD